MSNKERKQSKANYVGSLVGLSVSHCFSILERILKELRNNLHKEFHHCNEKRPQLLLGMVLVDQSSLLNTLHAARFANRSSTSRSKDRIV
jgi:hypothetical protein